MVRHRHRGRETGSVIKQAHVPEESVAGVERAHSFSQPSQSSFICSLLLADTFHSFDTYINSISLTMKITAFALLALGASTSAYVVPDSKAAENAVEARMPVSSSA
jgi:hypothetical protein